MELRDVSHQVVAIGNAAARHAFNQVNVRRLRSGRLVAVFNEERFAFHHDSGQTVMISSDDDGASWSEPSVVLPFTDTTGNWDCGICELDDGTLIVNFTLAGYFKRGIRPEQPSWASGPTSEIHGDWTWSYRTMSWLGAHTVRSDDGGKTWSDMIPVNARPLKHAGCRLGAWLISEGSLLLGVYGRIRGYGEEGENESTRSASAAFRRRRVQLGVLLDDGVRRRQHRRLRRARDRAARRRPVGRDVAHAREPVGRREEHGDRGLRRRRLFVVGAEIPRTSGATRPSSRPFPTVGC